MNRPDFLRRCSSPRCPLVAEVGRSFCCNRCGDGQGRGHSKHCTAVRFENNSLAGFAANNSLAGFAEAWTAGRYCAEPTYCRSTDDSILDWVLWFGEDLPTDVRRAWMRLEFIRIHLHWQVDRILECHAVNLAAVVDGPCYNCFHLSA